MVVAQRVAVKAQILPFAPEQPQIATSNDYRFDNPDTRAAYKHAVKEGLKTRLYATYRGNGPSIGNDILAGPGEGATYELPRLPPDIEDIVRQEIAPRMMKELGTHAPWEQLTGNWNTDRDKLNKMDRILYNVSPQADTYFEQQPQDRRGAYQALLQHRPERGRKHTYVIASP